MGLKAPKTALEVLKRCYGWGTALATNELAEARKRGVKDQALIDAYTNGGNAVDAVLYPSEEVAEPAKQAEPATPAE